MTRKLLFILCTFSVYATNQDYLTNWTKYRLTEMFEQSDSTDDISQHFSENAWGEFQTALEQSNIKKHHEDSYQIRLTEFIKPVTITNAENNTYFAQSTFLVKFSNKHSSWLQPMELILTIKDDNGKILITQFEGQTTKPIDVQNYAIDHAKECNS